MTWKRNLGQPGVAAALGGCAAVRRRHAAGLLNAEGVFTALLARFAFRENFDRRVALGMLAIVAAVVLSWPAGSTGGSQVGSIWPALAVLGACLAWAIDSIVTLCGVAR